MKRIAIDMRFWAIRHAGLSRYSRNLLREVLKIDNKTHYTAILLPEAKEEFNLTAANLGTIYVDAPHYSIAEQTKLLSVLNKYDFDLVHFTSFNHPILYRRTFIVTIHDLILQLFPEDSGQQSLIKRSGYRIAMNDCRRAKRIIVPSQATKADLVRILNFPSNQIVITPEGAEKKFSPQPKERVQAVRKKFNIPETYVLFVSRWEKYKGLPVLLEAFDSLSARYPQLGLVVCGKPRSNSNAIVGQIKRLQTLGRNVIVPGFVSEDDLVSLYGGASVYVHPSWYEGFGIMVLEAMSTGVPVVTSNISSMPEILGDAGILVDPKSSQEIAGAIEKIITDPALQAKYRREGLLRAKQFGWDKMAQLTYEIYQELLQK